MLFKKSWDPLYSNVFECPVKLACFTKYCLRKWKCVRWMEKFFNIMANWNNCTVSYFFDTKVFSLLDLKKSVYFLLIFTNLLFGLPIYINWSSFSNERNTLFGKLFRWIVNKEKKSLGFCFCFHCYLHVWKEWDKIKTDRWDAHKE